MADLVLTNVDLGRGAPLGLRLSGGRIAEVTPDPGPSPSDEVIDVEGGGVLPGLHDHHLHLLAAGALGDSLQVGPPQVTDGRAFRRALSGAHRALAAGLWIRAVGYHESVAGALDRHALDRIVAERPIRVQHRSGVQWVLNTWALGQLPQSALAHPGVERDGTGSPTGVLTRMDRDLARVVDPPRLDLAGVSRRAAGAGITGFTDATPLAGSTELDALQGAVAGGHLTQHLTVMSAPDTPLDVPTGFRLGPVKLLLDDARLPDYPDLCSTIGRAHRDGRAVAIHCVTRVQTVLATAVLADVGSIPGDRIEHGSVIPAASIPELARLGVVVVTNPGFVAARGDRYRHEVDRGDRADLYRCASLRAAGVTVAAGTDAPFGPADPWDVARAATTRLTRQGVPLGPDERLSPAEALGLFLGRAEAPGEARSVAPGQVADLCVLHLPIRPALDELSAGNVALCIIGGKVAADNR
ncbi:MAG: amidohydrolase family protein [Acidimicrobiales bacterium]